MTFPMKQHQASPACQARVCREVINGGSSWSCPAPLRHQTSKMQRTGHVLGWALWHPKGREPPDWCCAAAKHGVGIKRGCSKHETCPQLPTSPCIWGINGLEAAPTALALGAFTLGSALQGLMAGRGWWCPSFTLKRYFCWVGACVFLQK